MAEKFQDLVEIELKNIRQNHEPIQYYSKVFSFVNLELQDFIHIVSTRNPDKRKLCDRLVKMAARAQMAAEDLKLV